MKIALEYTLIGMGTVFLVLVFLSFVIWLLKFISPHYRVNARKDPEWGILPDSGSAASDKAAEYMDQSLQTEETCPVSGAFQEGGSVQSDGQLVAVIAAAVKAYMEGSGRSSDGYVVRSIRRR